MNERAEPFVVRCLTGKLMGARAGQLSSMAEFVGFTELFRSEADKVVGPVVICADYRQLQVLKEEVAIAVLTGLRQFNAKLERSALMLPTHATTLRLQMDRLLREAKHPGRRVCSDAAEVKAWPSSCLDATEQSRLDEFLKAPD